MVDAGEALRLILDATPLLGKEKLHLHDALGRTLAEDVVASESIPPFDNSSMDGFAVRSADLGEASGPKEVILEIVGESSAGNTFEEQVHSGQVVRIMTGGKIPDGADTVVPIEHARVMNEDHAGFNEPAPAGRHVRRAGEDISKGETILRAGDVIGPSQLGILASLGYVNVRAYEQPLVKILATGDELAEIDAELEDGQIRNSTSYALSGYVRQAGGIPSLVGIVPDKRKRIKKRIREALECDLLLITGGVSVGKYDFVKEILEGLGVEVIFWKVNIKPGKPLVFGRIRQALVFGLPGNPVSTGVTFLQFVRPALHKLLGRRVQPAFRLRATLEHDVAKSDGKRHYLRGIAREVEGHLRVSTTGSQSSGVMSSLSKGNCLIIVPEQSTGLKIGDQVDVEFL